MKTIDYKDIQNQFYNDQFKFYNIYNLDIDPELFYGVQYYNNTKENSENIQKLNIVFTDIESYQQDKTVEFKFNESLHPISAISFYYNGTYFAYFLNIYNVKIDIKEWADDFKRDLIKNNYIEPTDEIEITIFNDELELIKEYWNKIKSIDPIILSGWNSDLFDYPYIYRRMLILLNDDKSQVDSIISQFNYIKIYKDKLQIPEYNICDLLYLYKPRDDRGRNYGKKQISYSLNYISDIELNLKKFEYKTKNIDLAEFYEKDPKGYLFYNIIDVVLCVKLNAKLKHIELHNDIRRRMKCPFTKSLTGSSSVFDSFVISELEDKFRFGAVKQKSKFLKDDILNKLPKLRMKNKKGQLIEPNTITEQDYGVCVYKYDGAYVNQPSAGLKKNGVTFSLDATSMYPSMMLQHNISFDCYTARIFSSNTYKIIDYLNKTVGKENNIPEQLVLSIFDLVNKYIDSADNISNKEKTRKNLYFILVYLLDRLYKNKIPINKILKPSSDKEQILLSCYLIDILNIITIIHVNRESYNDVIYSYMFDEPEVFKNKFPKIYITIKPNTTHEYIQEFTNEQFIQFVNQYISTIAGTCFEKHENRIGLFTNMLENFSKIRKDYQHKMENAEKGSELWNFYNSRQNSIKIVMNTNYGVQGLKTFRFSNTLLAHSISTQGKLTIKLAQFIADKYLSENNF